MAQFISRLRDCWDKLSSLHKRLVTAVVLAPLALGIVWIGGIVYSLACVAVALIAFREWLGLVQTQWPKSLEYTAYATITATLAVFVTTSASLALIPFVIGFLAVAALAHLHIDQGKNDAPQWICGGLVYVTLPFACLLWLRHTGSYLVPAYGWAPLLMVLLSVWSTDSFAYFTGRAIGGLKLAPAISPNKTWSGLIGGVIASALVTGLLAFVWDFRQWPIYVLIGATLAVTAQLGDLFESWVKRRADVKDSGTIIPGHGGMLDRIDGLLTAAPLFTLFMWILSL